MQGKVEEPEDENKQAKETEKDVPKTDLSEKPEESKTGEIDKPSQELQDPEATTEVNTKPGGQTVGVTSPKTEDAKLLSQESTTAKSAEKEKKSAPVKPVEEDTPKPDKQATPEHAESRKLTIAEDTKEDTSAKNTNLIV